MHWRWVRSPGGLERWDPGHHHHKQNSRYRKTSTVLTLCIIFCMFWTVAVSCTSHDGAHVVWSVTGGEQMITLRGPSTALFVWWQRECWPPVVIRRRGEATHIAVIRISFERVSNINSIKAIFSTRPLSPLSSDPNELDYLSSPHHFLISRPIIALPETKVKELPYNCLQRWQQIQFMTQKIWNRRQKKVLHQLHNNQDGPKSSQILKGDTLCLFMKFNVHLTK